MIDIDLHKTLRSAHGNPYGNEHGSLRLQFCAQLAMHSLCGLSGPSGAGKTTLLRMLAGLTVPDHGRLVVNGQTWFDSARQINLPTRQRAIGMVFQDYALFPHLSVRDNVAFGVGKAEQAWVDELLALSGLSDMQQCHPASLSGGQQQRVALARAMTRKPALLLLDEPLSALDDSLRRACQDQLEKFHQAFGLTTLLVSHDIAELFRLAARVIRIEQGQIVASGSPAEVFLRQHEPVQRHLQAKLLAIHRGGDTHRLSLLIGGEMFDMTASEAEIAGLAVGDSVALAARPVRSLNADAELLIRR